MLHRISRLALLLALTLSSPVFALAGGLEFIGIDHSAKDRTGFDVFGPSGIRYESFFDISFDFAPRYSYDYGYIFSVSSPSEDRTWNLSWDSRRDSVEVRLNERGVSSVIVAVFDKAEVPALKWTRIRVVFDSSEGMVRLSLYDREYSSPIKDMKPKGRVALEFGICGNDVISPSFIIENLEVDRGIGKPILFPLDESQGDVAHARGSLRKGKVSNGVWRSYNSTHWSKVTEISSRIASGCVYDSLRHQAYFFNEEGISKCDITNPVWISQKYANECPVRLQQGTAFIRGNHLIVYENYIPDDDLPAVASLDLNTLKWKTLSCSHIDNTLHHHALFFLPDSSAVIFGGFGRESYGDKFYRLDKGQGGWKEVFNEQQTRISPRFFSSAGTDPKGQYAYLFGGVGNDSGSEVVGKRYLYDLHRLDLRTGNVEKLWDISSRKGDMEFVVGRGLVVEDGFFYALCYPEYIYQSSLSLRRFSLSDGEFENIADPIEMCSDAICTNANLYVDRGLGQMVAITNVFENNVYPTSSIFTITYPPQRLQTSRSLIPFLIAAVLLLLCLSAVLVLRARIIRKKALSSDSEYQVPYLAKHSNSICVFGPFEVRDAANRDISYRFSPLLRDIFIYFLKNREEGVSGQKLSSVFWPDKDEDKAKNSRGVALNNLRKALSDLVGVDIVYEDYLYKLKTTDEFWCDYLLVDDFLKGEDRTDIRAIVSLASTGEFLSKNENPLFDTFKEEVNGRLVTFLYERALDHFQNDNFSDCLFLCKIILGIEGTEEGTMTMAVKSYLKLKDKDAAMSLYSNFCARWKAENDAKYAIAFKQISNPLYKVEK